SSYSLYSDIHHRASHSFPTRRSSDLAWGIFVLPVVLLLTGLAGAFNQPQGVVSGQASFSFDFERFWPILHIVLFVLAAVGVSVRSEEHTSELQSRVDLVCRLLLEKKK